jgi:membrane protease YdiL (CAAX protease family)
LDDPNFTQPAPPALPDNILSAPTPQAAPGPHLLHRIFFGDEGLRAGWGILLFVLICIGTNYAVSMLHLFPSQPHTTPAQPSPEMPPVSSIVSEGIILSLVSLATLILSRIERRPIGVYGLGGSGRLRLFLRGLFWGLVLLCLLVLVLWQAHLLVFDRLLLTPAAMFRYGAVWAFGFLIVALFEETFLRGYLQFTLTRGFSALYRPFTTPKRAGTFGFWTAALVLCSIFGFGHSNNPGESPFGLFAVGLFGLTFIFSLWRTGSLWWAIGAHTSWNWAQSFLYGVGDSGNMVRYHLLASHPIGQPLLSGGTTGPEGSVFVLPTLALLAAAAFFAVPRTHRSRPTSPLSPTQRSLTDPKCASDRGI